MQVGLAVMPNLGAYLTFKFLWGVFAQAANVAIFTLASEVMGPATRP